MPILQMRKLRPRVSGLGHGACKWQGWDFDSGLCEFRALAFNYYGINVKLAFRFFQL